MSPEEIKSLFSNALVFINHSIDNETGKYNSTIVSFSFNCKYFEENDLFPLINHANTELAKHGIEPNELRWIDGSTDGMNTYQISHSSRNQYKPANGETFLKGINSLFQGSKIIDISAMPIDKDAYTNERGKHDVYEELLINSKSNCPIAWADTNESDEPKNNLPKLFANQANQLG